MISRVLSTEIDLAIPPGNPHTAVNVCQEENKDDSITVFVLNENAGLKNPVLDDQVEVEACRTEQSTKNLLTDSKPYQSGMSGEHEELFMEK